MNESLTNRQIIFIIFGIVVGYGVLGIAKNVAESAGTGGWFVLLIATVIVTSFTYIITYLGYIHENKTIYEYSNLLVGKNITYIIITIYYIYFFMLFTMIIRMASESIKLMLLINTPVWIFSLVFLVVVYYITIKRLSVIARICEIYGLIIVVCASMLHISMFTQGKLINLRPFFVLGNIQTYIKSIMVTIVPFLGIEILMIIPFNKEKNNKKVLKYTTLATAFIGIFYILIVESCISIMGVDSIIYYKDALFASIRRIDIRSLQFLERLDGIFIILWIIAIFCTISLEAYASVFLSNKIFKKVNFNYMAIIVLTLSFIISQIPSTIDEVEAILNYMKYYGIVTGGIIPLILFIITKRKKVPQENN